MSMMKVDTTMNNVTEKRQAWHVASKLQNDLTVEVDDVIFHLHKFPLLSRSGLLNRLVFESRDTENSHIKLVDFPGGAKSFELAAKFCYGSDIVEITASNVAALRCAAEYLEMTEDLEEGNLISKTEAFLSYILMASWLDCITVLQSCCGLSPWAENLNIEQRCVESIAWKAVANHSRVSWEFTRPKKTYDVTCPSQKHCILHDNYRFSTHSSCEGGESSAHENVQLTPPADIGLEIQKLRAEFGALEKLCQSIVEQLEKVSTKKISILGAFPWKYFKWKSRNNKQKGGPFSSPMVSQLRVETDEKHEMPCSRVAKPNSIMTRNSSKPRRNSI